MADQQHARTVSKAYASFVIAGVSLAGKRSASQFASSKLFVSEQHLPFRGQYLHQSIEQKPRLGVVMIFLMDCQSAVGGEVEQPLRRFHILDFRVIHLARELPE
jgi:hypothetical protein